MSVDTRHQAHSDCSTDRFGNLTLVHRPQSGDIAVLDPSHGRDIFRHDREVLGTGDGQWPTRQPPTLQARARTLYRSVGFKFNASKASAEGFERFLHLLISVGLRS